ncbi:hypothetical protein CW304_24240 [Bacillus sp. UFRGS-B20]|nr:hypothetical protein CW304_24240 [Bacillus sp. UFRGS-B20]
MAQLAVSFHLLAFTCGAIATNRCRPRKLLYHMLFKDPPSFFSTLNTFVSPYHNENPFKCNNKPLRDDQITFRPCLAISTRFNRIPSKMNSKAQATSYCAKVRPCNRILEDSNCSAPKTIPIKCNYLIVPINI